MTTVLEALARCAITRTWAVNMCDNFCANMYGYGNSGYVDAVAHWNAYPDGRRHPGEEFPPPGALAFWGGGHGHVAIADGTGYIWSTDIAGAGTVARVPLSLVATRWGKPYLGWAPPMFQDKPWSGTMPRVMRDSTNAADIPITGTDLAAGYLNGSYAWSAASWARFPDIGHVTIDVNGTRPDADVLDVEPGDATVAGGVRWLPKALAVSRGYPPVIYCNRSNRTAFVTAAKAAGFSVNTHFKFWVATLDGTRTLSDMNGVCAIQWGGANQTGGHYDQSDVFDDAWKATDMPLTAADKTWITNLVKTTVEASVKPLRDNLMSITSLTEKDAAGQPVKHAAGWYIAHIAADSSGSSSGVKAAAGQLVSIKAQAEANGVTGSTILQQLTALVSTLNDPAGFIAQLEAELTQYKVKLEKETP